MTKFAITAISDNRSVPCDKVYNAVKSVTLTKVGLADAEADD
jgi:hypothetical protein